jgi:hypothetical protein
MPRGGARPGAGRKPKGDKPVRDRTVRVLQMPYTVLPPAWAPPPMDQAPETDSPLVAPRFDCYADEQSVWMALAPWAIAQGTLDEARIPGFRKLCHELFLAQTLKAELDRLGPSSAEGVRILKPYLDVSKALDASLMKFRLTAFGKAMDPGKSKPVAPANPWASMARKA